MAWSAVAETAPTVGLVFVVFLVFRRMMLPKRRTSAWLGAEGVALDPTLEAETHRWIVRMSMARSTAAAGASCVGLLWDVGTRVRAESATRYVSEAAEPGAAPAREMFTREIWSFGLPILAYVLATVVVDAWRRRSRRHPGAAIAVAQRRTVRDAADDSLELYAFVGFGYVVVASVVTVSISAFGSATSQHPAAFAGAAVLLGVGVAAAWCARAIVRRPIRAVDDAGLASEEVLSAANTTSAAAVAVACVWMFGGQILLVSLRSGMGLAAPVLIVLSIPAWVAPYYALGMGTYSPVRTARLRRVRRAALAQP